MPDSSRRDWIIAALVALSVGGCGGDKRQDPAPPAAPEQLTVGSAVTHRVALGAPHEYAIQLAGGTQYVAALIDPASDTTLFVFDTGGRPIGGGSGCGGGIVVQTCTVTLAAAGTAFLRVTASAQQARYVLVVAPPPAAQVPTGVVPVTSGSLIAGAVATRSQTQYSLQGVLPGARLLIALFGQDGATDLRVYDDASRSLQFFCGTTLVTSTPPARSCSIVSPSDTVAFDVAAGPLERSDARYWLYVWQGLGPFEVTDTTPRAGVEAVRTAPVTLRFSEMVDPGSVSSASVVLRAAGVDVPSSLRTIDNTVVITPVSKLPATSAISVSVNGVAAASGEAMGGPFTLQFTTFADPEFAVIPVPTAQDIAPGATAGAELIVEHSGVLEPVELTLLGCPPAAQCTVSPGAAFLFPVQWNGAPFAESVALRVVTSAATPPGSYAVEVHAAGSIASHDASFGVSVGSPPAAGAPRMLWGDDGIGLSVALGNQTGTVSAPDGAGGLLAVWQDDRSGSGYPQLGAQRIGPDGVPLWWGQGVAVTSFPNAGEGSPAILGDGGGGMLVAFNVWNPDTGQKDVFAQRLGPDGAQIWGPKGVAISTACVGFCVNQKEHVQIAPDGTGGAFVAWQEMRDGFHFSIWAQRIDADGHPLWAKDGIAVRDGPFYRMRPRMVADGQGGAIVVWRDLEVGFAAQRLDASGNLSWGTAGITLGGSLGENAIDYPGYDLVPDGANGAFVAWIDNRSSTTSDADVYATRITSAGELPWGPSGTAVCTRTRAQYHARLAADGAGGVILVWEDQGASTTGAQLVYAQRLDGAGAAQWAANGVAVNADHSSYPLVWPAWGGGALVTWDSASPGKPAIGTQRLDSRGAHLWGDAGFFVVPPGVNYGYAPVSVPDGAGGLFIHWMDYRLPAPWPLDVYVTRVTDG